MKPRRHVVNVGANIGTTTISASARRFPAASHARPSRAMSLLELNLVANGHGSKVAVCAVAVGESDREVELLVLKRQAGLHEVRTRGRPAPGWPSARLAPSQRRRPRSTRFRRRASSTTGRDSLSRSTYRDTTHTSSAAPESLTQRRDAGAYWGLPEPETARRTSHVNLSVRQQLAHRSLPRALQQRQADPSINSAAKIDRLLSGGFVRGPSLLVDPRAPLLPRPPGPPPARPGACRPHRRRRGSHGRGGTAPSTQQHSLAQTASPLRPARRGRVDGATFLVRTAAGAWRAVPFTEGSHPRLRRLSQRDGGTRRARPRCREKEDLRRARCWYREWRPSPRSRGTGSRARSPARKTRMPTACSSST